MWLVVRPTYSVFEKAHYYYNPVIRDRKPEDNLNSAYKYDKVISCELYIIDHGDHIEISDGTYDRPLTYWDDEHSKEIKNPGYKIRRDMIFSLFWNGVV